MPPKIKASIIGVTGYTGLETLRLLLAHPQVEIVHLTSRQHENAPIGEVFAHLSHLDLRVSNIDHKELAAESDIVFVALPHKTAQDVVADLHEKTRVIDLSADYRLDDEKTYERYYETHKYPELLKQAVYGAPEITPHEKIAAAGIVANPGCFALLGQLMLYPFKGHILHADLFAITGSSGSGRTASDGTHHPVRNHNIKSYNINVHRHIPEITRAADITEEQLNFVPTSGPFTRGIFAQAFVDLQGEVDVQALIDKAYKNAHFIRIKDEVALANVVGSNYVDLSYRLGHDGRIMIQGALDNLVKGAAGTAVQNMNIMFAWDETLGLGTLAPVYP